jgi:magnesium transporter
VIYFTELDRLPFYDIKGHYLGRIVDLGIEPSQDPLRVACYFVRTPERETVCIPHEQLQSVSVRAAQAGVPEGELRRQPPNGGVIRIRKDVLDQQIIDVHDRKVVRVNDVEFDIMPNDRHADLRIVAVDPSFAAAIRRLLQGLLAKHHIRVIAGVFPSRSIPWELVNLIEPDAARRVKLRLSYDQLSKIHPADLAEMLKELTRDEQRSLIEALDDETAAQAVSEIPTRMQVALLESIRSEKAAGIVEAMPPDAAADVLQELPTETSATVLASMEIEEAEKVRELLGFERDTAGGLMTSQFVAVDEHATVADAVSALRGADLPTKSVHAAYLVDGEGKLAGVVPLIRMLLSDSVAALRPLSTDPILSVGVHTDSGEIRGLFQKYALVELPVVDDGGRLVGVVTVDDILDPADQDGR